MLAAVAAAAVVVAGAPERAPERKPPGKLQVKKTAKPPEDAPLFESAMRDACNFFTAGAAEDSCATFAREAYKFASQSWENITDPGGQARAAREEMRDFDASAREVTASFDAITMLAFTALQPAVNYWGEPRVLEVLGAMGLDFSPDVLRERGRAWLDLNKQDWGAILRKKGDTAYYKALLSDMVRARNHVAGEVRDDVRHVYEVLRGERVLQP